MKPNSCFRGTSQPRKPLVATHVAPTPLNTPQRPSKDVLEAFCRPCWGTGFVVIAWGYSDPCPYCNGTGYAKEKK
jgi:excinuclease UvrABC ATPase subunit